MVRTQVYLTEKERSALRRLAHKTGKTQSELIRLAVDRLAEHLSEVDRLDCLKHGRGLWSKRDDLPDWRSLRGELDRG